MSGDTLTSNPRPAVSAAAAGDDRLAPGPGAPHRQHHQHAVLHQLRLQPARGHLLVARRGQDIQLRLPGIHICRCFMLFLES